MRIIAGCFSTLNGDEQEALSQILNKLGENIHAARHRL
jgi:hypothetical protein